MLEVHAKAGRVEAPGPLSHAPSFRRPCFSTVNVNRSGNTATFERTAVAPRIHPFHVLLLVVDHAMKGRPDA